MGEEKGGRGTGVTGPGTQLIPFPYMRCLCGLVFLFIASCSSTETGYFPTAPGHEWTYDIRRIVPEFNEPIVQKSIVRNLPARTVGDITYYPKAYANGSIRHFTRSADGISRRNPGHEGADPVIGYPLSVGSEWSAGSRLYLFDLPKKLEGAWDRISSNLELDYTITSLDDPVDVRPDISPDACASMQSASWTCRAASCWASGSSRSSRASGTRREWGWSR